MILSKAIRCVGVERIREKNIGLCERLIAGADARGLQVHIPRNPAGRGGMVCIDFEGAAAAEAELVRRRFFVDYRPRCGLRISPHFYTGEDEIEKVLEEIDRFRNGQA